MEVQECLHKTKLSNSKTTSLLHVLQKGGLGYGHRQTIELQNAFREKLTLAKKVEDAFCMKKNK